jgi:hypothetical protein
MNLIKAALAPVLLLVASCVTYPYESAFSGCDNQAGNCYRYCEDVASNEGSYRACHADCEYAADQCFADVYGRYSYAGSSYGGSYYSSPSWPWYGRYGAWGPSNGYYFDFSYWSGTGWYRPPYYYDYYSYYDYDRRKPRGGGKGRGRDRDRGKDRDRDGNWDRDGDRGGDGDRGRDRNRSEPYGAPQRPRDSGDNAGTPRPRQMPSGQPPRNQGAGNGNQGSPQPRMTPRTPPRSSPPPSAAPQASPPPSAPAPRSAPAPAAPAPQSSPPPRTPPASRPRNDNSTPRPEFKPTPDE